MPELPEVEVVRLGLVPALTGAQIGGVEVLDGRSLKRHLPVADAGESAAYGHGTTLPLAEQQRRAADFEKRLTGAMLLEPRRRGKFLWIPLAGGAEALLAHLGMSGQLLLRAEDAPDDKHVRIRLWVNSPGQPGLLRLDFADQRRFGSLALDRLDAAGVPLQAGHIAPDPLEADFDLAAAVKRMKAKGAPIKNVLLDQTVLSGIGNIYADEALWQARIHPLTPAARISEKRLAELIEAAREVFLRALAEGGTSFDSLYVNVDGESGYFARSLNAYGRAGDGCHRCGTLLERITVGGRSGSFCPQCQRRR